MPLYQAHGLANPDVFEYTEMGPFADLRSACTWYELTVRRDPGATWFAVIDTTTEDGSDLESDLGGRYAGAIGLRGASDPQSQCELWHYIIVPESQYDDLHKRSLKLLFHWLFSLDKDGLGLRRVQWWVVNGDWAATRAENMRFRREAVLKWQVVLPKGKRGKEDRDGQDHKGPGADAVILSTTWDNWWEAGI